MMVSTIGVRGYLALVLSYFSTLASADLPAYTGTNGVGTIDIEVPVSNPTTYGNSVLQNGSRPAFRLDTVLFTIYYPSAKGVNSTKQGHLWYPEPRNLIAQGLAGAGNVSPKLVQLGFEIYTQNLTLPAQVDVPIQSGSDKYPVILFSHGQPTMPMWYSVLYGEVASRGAIVVSATHRDGSAPATSVRFKNGTSYNVTAFTESSITPQLSSDDFHARQLEMRQGEWNEIGRVITSLNNGNGSAIYNASSRSEGESLSGFKDRFDLSRVIVSGHSFGANTALKYLRASTPTLAARASILYDPGQESGPLTPSNQTISIPLVIAQSQEWSAIPKPFYGSTHFATVKNTAEQAQRANSNASWFMTLAGTVHSSITDVGIIAPSFATFFTNNTDFITLQPRDAIMQYVSVTMDLLNFVRDGSVTGLLDVDAKYPNWQNVSNATTLGASPWEVHVSRGKSKSKTSGTNRLGGQQTLLMLIVPCLTLIIMA